MKKNEFSEMKKKGQQYGSDIKSLYVGIGLLMLVIIGGILYFYFG